MQQKEGSEIIVSICCLIYNHAPYLRECFEGFVMQKTNFPIEILVHDDASTDGSQEIIKEYTAKYPTLFKPIYQKENQYSKGIGVSVTYQFPRAKGKYIALCEGDDYWTDPYKLQKQVDFLEVNLDYILCCHRYKIYNQDLNSWNDDYVASLFEEHPGGFTFTNKENFDCWITKTMTLMFRRCDEVFDVLPNYKYFRDVHLNYHLLRLGKGYCFPWNAAVYRRHKGGVFSTKDVFTRKELAYKIFYEIKRSNPEDLELDVHWLRIYYIYFSELRLLLYERKCSIFIMKKICIFVYNEYNMYGVKRMIWVLRKFFLSYLKGFKLNR